MNERLEAIRQRCEKATPEHEPYFIEVDDAGCVHCKEGRTWNVIGPDGVCLSTSYGDEEAASDIADICNDAFERGQQTSDIPYLLELLDQRETNEKKNIPEISTQLLIDSGINAFALKLLGESLAGKKDIRTFNPIQFSYRGVIYTLEPVRRGANS